jgi:argininosuccinate synthase
MKKVILAYSGGLDTSCCIRWLKEKGFKVICFSANLGSEFVPSDLRKRAMKTGADKIYIKDLRNEFSQNYILPALKANACYQDKYLLATALGRPLIAKYLVEIAKKENAKYIAHGCTAKGNDQLRIEASIKILDPSLNIIAPLREWELTSRKSEIEYANKHKIPIKVDSNKIYSIDSNIWGTSVEAGILEDITKSPPLNSYIDVAPLDKTPAKEEILQIKFKNGTPTTLDKKRFSFRGIIERLNSIGAKHGIGRTDLIEDRVVGIKSREIYEAPAAWILYYAHRELESLTLDRDIIFSKKIASLHYSNLVYRGLWFSSTKEALDSFINKTQDNVTGTIVLSLYKGTIQVIKRESKNSLYNKSLATYGKEDIFNGDAAAGFIDLFSLPYRVRD